MKFSTIFFLIGNISVFSSPMAAEQLYNLSGNNHLTSVGVDDLQQIVNEFPYFAPAQFILALKQKEQSSYSYNAQLQKAALHFSNPLWLQYQLHNGIIAEPVLQKVLLNSLAKSPAIAKQDPKVIETSIVPQPTNVSIPVVEESIATEHTNIITKEPIAIVTPILPNDASDISIETPLLNKVDEPILEVPIITNVISEVVEEIEPVKNTITTNPEIKVPVDEGYDEAPTSFSNKSLNSNVVDSNGIVDYSAYALSNSFKEEPKPVVTVEPTPNLQDQSLTNNIGTYNTISNNSGGFSIPTLEAVKKLLDVNTVAPAIELEAPKLTTATIPSYSFNGFADVNKQITPNAVALSEAYNDDEIEVLEEENKNQTNNISSVLSSQMADFKKPISEDAKLEFEAEPLFKVDYFASQGIKIDLTKQPQDKLTIQLRRFTDWLKQIKGQSPNPQDLGTDPELEKAISNIAKASIAAREIVTETMADVFIKQGKVDKAIQLYIKLSFLDPNKSAYFAGRIQQLKGI